MTYNEALKNIIPWLREQIVRHEEIYVKVNDIKKEMGEEFINKNEHGFYVMIKDILLENGIKMKQCHHKYDGDKILNLTLANEGEIIQAKDARYLRRKKTTEKLRLNCGYGTYYSRISKGHMPMDENPDCPLYFGEYIEKKYVMTIFEDVIPFESPKNEYGRLLDNHKKYDWICKNEKKIKHIASCVRLDDSHIYKNGDRIPYFGYSIRRNKVPDYYMLSGWDNRESLEPQFVWLVNNKEDFRTQYGYRKFWRTETFLIYITKKGISRMEKYEMNNILEKLKDSCMNSKNMNIDKRRDINVIVSKLNRHGIVDEKELTYFPDIQ